MKDLPCILSPEQDIADLWSIAMCDNDTMPVSNKLRDMMRCLLCSLVLSIYSHMRAVLNK